MIPEHTVSKREVKMKRKGEVHVRILDMEGVYCDDDEYVLLQHFEEGSLEGEIPVHKDDVPNLIDGLEWTVEE